MFFHFSPQDPPISVHPTMRTPPPARTQPIETCSNERILDHQLKATSHTSLSNLRKYNTKAHIFLFTAVVGDWMSPSPAM